MYTIPTRVCVPDIRTAVWLINEFVELYILSRINRIPIVIYDQDDEVVYIFVKGLVYNKHKNKTLSDKYNNLLNENKFDCINLRFIFMSNKYIPESIESIYFKA